MVIFLFAYFNTNLLWSTLFICFVLDGLLQSTSFRMFCSKHSINFESTYLLKLLIHVCFRYKFKCFVYHASLSCISHSIDICIVAIKIIRNMHAVLINQIADILRSNDKITFIVHTKNISNLID